MTQLYKAQCMMAVAVAGSGGEVSPLNDLPIQSFLQWCSTMGGQSIRIPTMAEIVAAWEVARVLGQNHRIHDLWQRAQSGVPVSFRECEEILDTIAAVVPPDQREQLRIATRILLMVDEDRHPDPAI